MPSLISQFQFYQKDPATITALVEQEIDYRIQTGLYPPREEWSHGSYDMIRSNIESSLNHTFTQSINLLQKIQSLAL